MNLQNGYKVVYEKAVDDKRAFLGSKTGLFADAETIAEIDIGKYKLIYEKAGRLYGSENGVPAEDDYCFEAFDRVFIVDAADDATAKTENPEVVTEEVENNVGPFDEDEEEDEE